MSGFEGRTALVTGGSRGIGRAVALRLAAEGALVAVHYGSNAEAAERTVEEIAKSGGAAFALRADLREPGAPAALAAALREALRAATGDDGLDLLVNNAGILNTAPVEAVTEQAWDAIFTLNLKAPFFLIQALLPVLRDGGRVVNMSSINARLALPTAIEYAMTKAALESMTRSLAPVLAPRGITVNALAAGAATTDMMSFLDFLPDLKTTVDAMSVYNRMATPDDIASAVLLLCSPTSTLITGQVVDASGGSWLGP
ncbi:A-factor type gamma-butyrolactone 6-reductase ScbB [Actinocorallia aurea]